MIPTPLLVVSRCGSCHARFLPRRGPCPKCGSSEIAPEPMAPEGEVLAATELSSPAPGWSNPHRLALVELADGVRVLAVAARLPEVGARVLVAAEGDHYAVVDRPSSPG
jgi:uncharacterized OB-fold protein